MPGHQHHIKKFDIAGHGRLVVAHTNTKDVVTISGSILGGVNHLPRSLDVVPGFVTDLLDAGTKRKTKDSLRNALADRGISLSFSSGGDRTYWSGYCLPEDTNFLFSIITECLKDATLPAAEIQKERTRMLASYHKAKSDTGTRARIAFARLVYDPRHVGYSNTIEEEERRVASLRRPDLVTFKNMLGRGGLILAVTGDVEADVIRTSAEKTFGMLPVGTNTIPAKELNKKKPVATEELISLPDKANIDTFLGAALPLRTSDALYHPLLVLADMLGGGFASHLMRTIRDRDGLTYGVYARLRGFAHDTDGSFRIWAAFAPELYERGRDTLNTEVRAFFASGITETALEKKKEEIIGSYLVSLSTTGGLANAIQGALADARDLSYVTEFPNIIRSVTLADVQAVASLIPLENLALVAAGTFPKK